MKSEFILFDFDGVIADTFQMCFNIVRQANPSETEQTFKQRFITNSDNCEIPNLTTSAGIDFFKEYSSRILDQPPANNIADALKFISENFTTILVSSTTSPPIKKYIDHHNLANCFSAIFCNDIPTSKSEKFKIILQHYRTAPSECVFVTDTLGDIKEAHKVNIPSVGVTWGYHDQALLQSGNPVTIIDYPTQLKGAIEEALDFSGEYDEIH
jgi:phosphoglycolate phosphatase